MEKQGVLQVSISLSVLGDFFKLMCMNYADKNSLQI